MTYTQKPLTLHEITSFEELNYVYSQRLGLVTLAKRCLTDLEKINFEIDPKIHIYDYDTLTEMILTAEEEMEQLKTYYSLALDIEQMLCPEPPPF